MANKFGKVLSVLLMLTIIAAGVSCGENTPFAAEQVVDNVLAAQTEAESFRFDMYMSVDMDGEFDGEVMEMSMSMDASGVVDQTNREMEMDMGMEMEATGEEAFAMQMLMYLVDNYVYTKMDIPGEESVWEKQGIPVDFWEIQDTIDQSLELLQFGEVKALGYEEVRGVNCYVLEITPDLDELWDTVMQQSWMGEAPVEIPDLEDVITNLEDIIEEMSIKVWITEDTAFFTKAQMLITLLMTPETMGMMEGEGEVSMGMEMTIRAYDYNKPVSIQLPPGAENAEELPFL
jgi:hypothetical protein